MADRDLSRTYPTPRNLFFRHFLVYHFQSGDNDAPSKAAEKAPIETVDNPMNLPPSVTAAEAMCGLPEPRVYQGGNLARSLPVPYVEDGPRSHFADYMRRPCVTNVGCMASVKSEIRNFLLLFSFITYRRHWKYEQISSHLCTFPSLQAIHGQRYIAKVHELEGSLFSKAQQEEMTHSFLNLLAQSSFRISGSCSIVQETSLTRP